MNNEQIQNDFETRWEEFVSEVQSHYGEKPLNQERLKTEKHVAFLAYKSAATDRDELIECLRKEKRELVIENINLLYDIAPLLGLNPFFSKSNRSQVIWAESQEQANSLGLGESTLKFVNEALEKARAK